MIRNGLKRKDASKGYGPHKTVYNRFIRWEAEFFLDMEEPSMTNEEFADELTSEQRVQTAVAELTNDDLL